MHGPAIYRIRVRGKLDASWSDRIGGMQVTETRGPDGEVETILVGRLALRAQTSENFPAIRHQKSARYLSGIQWNPVDSE